MGAGVREHGGRGHGVGQGVRGHGGRAGGKGT